MEKGDAMKLYRILFDTEWYWVEAKDMTDAVAIWKEESRKLWGEGDEPESIELMHEGAVLRRI